MKFLTFYTCNWESDPKEDLVMGSGSSLRSGSLTKRSGSHLTDPIWPKRSGSRIRPTSNPPPAPSQSLWQTAFTSSCGPPSTRWNRSRYNPKTELFCYNVLQCASIMRSTGLRICPRKMDFLSNVLHPKVLSGKTSYLWTLYIYIYH